MKNLKSLNLGKSLNRSEMKSVAAMYTCTCGTKPPVAIHGADSISSNFNKKTKDLSN